MLLNSIKDLVISTNDIISKEKGLRRKNEWITEEIPDMMQRRQ